MREDDDDGKRRRFAIRRWGDVAAILAIVGSVISAIVVVGGAFLWLWKLDARSVSTRADDQKDIAAMRDRVKALEDKLGPGVLPITAERLDQLKQDIADLKQDNRSLHVKDDEILDRLVNCERLAKRR